ncbi:hypothetical protein RF11_02652 [Thelohanellus kitauei]|uniref:Uncharacterized protein n=1 Tax=Thelohanellus kitauei TaxID=669202 RepID=A0A0C2MGG8_THEKT|nr:hypothetical protein RF11_02652 [Thelohanellus kitauei]
MMLIFSVNNESVLKATFHKQSDELDFAKVVEICHGVEGASKTVRDQIQPPYKEVLRLQTTTKINFETFMPQCMCYTYGKKESIFQNCKFWNYVCAYCETNGHSKAVCTKKRNSSEIRNDKKYLIVQKWAIVSKPSLLWTDTIYKTEDCLIIPTMGNIEARDHIYGQLVDQIYEIRLVNRGILAQNFLQYGSRNFGASKTSSLMQKLALIVNQYHETEKQ